MTFSSEVADIIDLAAENLEQCPWGQGNGRASDGQICAQDAIWMAVAGQQSAKEYWSSRANLDLGIRRLQQFNLLSDEVIRVISLRLPDRYHGRLFAWNDRPGRTKEEVIELFKETAKDLRNSASPT
jgi:hypothetical protein